MDFSQFKAPEVANNRKPGGLPPKVQEFDALKYRKAQTKKSGIKAMFFLSTERGEAIKISENALRHFIHPTDKTIVLLGTVADADGKYLKSRKDKEKGDAFKSDALEAALNAAGIIDATAIKQNQFIAMSKVGENVEIDGIKVKEVFQLAKGAKKPVAPKVAEPASPAPGSVFPTDGASATVAAPGTAAPAGKSDWD